MSTIIWPGLYLHTSSQCSCQFFLKYLRRLFPSNGNIPTHLFLVCQVVARKVPALPFFLCCPNSAVDIRIYLLCCQPINKMSCLDVTCVFFWLLWFFR